MGQSLKYDVSSDRNMSEVKRVLNCRKFKEDLEKKWNLYLDEPVVYAVCAFYNAGQNMILAGPPGSGKTQLVKALVEEANIPRENYIRVQAYPGITYVEFIGDWDYPRQLLVLEAVKGGVRVTPENVDELLKQLDLRNRDKYFNKGPAVRALEKAKDGSILHIDELNSANEELQSLLFEIAGEKQVTHPTAGTFTSTDEYAPPAVYGEGKKADPFHGIPPQFPVIVATINEGDVATVELSAALRRRFARVEFTRPPADVVVKVIKKTVGPEGIEYTARILKRTLGGGVR